MEELDPERPGRSTGPRSPHGKENSSKNSLKHGCRSKIKILPTEKEEDFEATRQRWLAEFPTENDSDLQFVEQVILNDWFLQRTITRYIAVEEKLSGLDFSAWTEEQHKELQLAIRYKGDAERAFQRAIRSADLWRKNRNQEERQLQRDQLRLLKELHAEQDRTRDERDKVAEERRALHDEKDAVERLIDEAKKNNLEVPQPKREKMAKSENSTGKEEPPKTRAQLLFTGENSPKKQKKIHTLEQWVEIRVENGKTVTELTPSNAELIERGKRMYPPPDLVYRRFCFIDGVPPEYEWATDDPKARELGGNGIQRMTVDTWLDVIEKEKENPDGHVGITPDGNLPRPKERGGCDCPVCTNNQEILDRRAERELLEQ